MRRRGMLAAAFALLVLAAPAVAQQASPCAKADTLRSAGLLDEARAEYAKALEKDGSADCVTTGLADLAQRYLRRGLVLQRSGLSESATAAFTAAYDLDPDLDEEITAALGPERTVALARQLDERGRDSEARALLVEALKKQPELDVPDDLDHLFAADRESWWTDFLDWITPAARSVGELLLLVLVAFVVGQFVFSRVHRRLGIGDFTGPGADDVKATKASAEFQALVRARIHAISVARTGKRIDLAAPAGSAVGIPATVAKAVPQTAIVDAVLQLLQNLLPAAERPLSAQLLTASPRGLGVSVTLGSRFGGPRATRTFWADELPAGAFASTGPESYLPFVTIVAAWALAEFRPRAFSALGTTDPMSYAAFAIGAAEQGAAW